MASNGEKGAADGLDAALEPSLSDTIKPQPEAEKEEEEMNMPLSALGLNLKVRHSVPLPHLSLCLTANLRANRLPLSTECSSRLLHATRAPRPLPPRPDFLHAYLPTPNAHTDAI